MLQKIQSPPTLSATSGPIHPLFLAIIAFIANSAPCAVFNTSSSLALTVSVTGPGCYFFIDNFTGLAFPHPCAQ